DEECARKPAVYDDSDAPRSARCVLCLDAFALGKQRFDGLEVAVACDLPHHARGHGDARRPQAAWSVHKLAGEEPEATPFGRDGGDRCWRAFEARLARYGIDERAWEQTRAAAVRRAVGPVNRHEQFAGPLTGVERNAVDAVALWRFDAR